MTEEQIVLIVLISMAVWIICGPVIHLLFYAIPQRNFDPLGFCLSAFIGPFTGWALWWEHKQGTL